MGTSSSKSEIILEALESVLRRFETIFSACGLTLSLKSSVEALMEAETDLSDAAISESLPSYAPFAASLSFAPRSRKVAAFSVSVLIISLIAVIGSGKLSFICLSIVQTVSITVAIFVQVCAAVLSTSTED